MGPAGQGAAEGLSTNNTTGQRSRAPNVPTYAGHDHRLSASDRNCDSMITASTAFPLASVNVITASARYSVGS